MSDLESSELLARFRRGDSAAAGEVFDRYLERLLHLARKRISKQLARRVDPEDVVQSAYRSFFIRARNGDFVFERAGDLWRLLAAITLNKLYRQAELHTAQRRDVNKESADSESSVAPRDAEPSPVEVVEIGEQLRMFMESLNQTERTVLEQRLVGDTIEEIALDINRSQRTVRRLLQSLRDRLSTQLAG